MTTVKYAHSGMVGAPVISNGFGDLTNALDALLVNGFNLRTATGMTREGDTVTVTFATAHGYEEHQVVQISGADQAGYNGQHRVTWRDTLNIRFIIAGTPVTPATGTISCKAAPLCFEIAFTGTNKRVYRSPNPQSARPYLRVDDSQLPGYGATWAKFARVTAAEEMTDVDTIVTTKARAPFSPTSPNLNEFGDGVQGTGGIYGWYKWFYANINNGTSSGNSNESAGDGGNYPRQWFIVGDDRLFYFLIPPGALNQGRVVYAFGECNSYKAGDRYNVMLCATDRWVSAGTTDYQSLNYSQNAHMHRYNAALLLRPWTQIGSPTSFARFSLNTNNNTPVSGRAPGIPFPNGPDMAMVTHPTYIREGWDGSIRGTMPGMHWVFAHEPYAHLTMLDNLVGVQGRRFMYVTCLTSDTWANNAGHCFDITGPWR